MTQRKPKGVLFLCTGNYYRSRYAEIFFNSVAVRMGLPWKASSRGLALERGVNNVGPIAVATIAALQKLNIRASEEMARFPLQAVADDLERADWIVALKQEEHYPLLVERFPTWAEKIEYWQVDDAPGVLPLIEREVVDLTARLIGGGTPRKAPTPETTVEAVGQEPKKVVASAVVRVGRETKGRRGKGVTTVTDLPLNQAELLDLAAKLKQRCGTGGTVKDGRIEIQGDQRQRLIAELTALGYRVKSVGG